MKRSGLESSDQLPRAKFAFRRVAHSWEIIQYKAMPHADLHPELWFQWHSRLINQLRSNFKAANRACFTAARRLDNGENVRGFLKVRPFLSPESWGLISRSPTAHAAQQRPRRTRKLVRNATRSGDRTCLTIYLTTKIPLVLTT